MKQLPSPEGMEGDFIPRGESASTVEDYHTTELAAELAGRGRVSDVVLTEITTEWVLKRLVREATDFGTRTRQTGRIKALELIGEHLGMWDKVPEGDEDENTRRVRELPRAERLSRIRELAAKMAKEMG